MITIIFFFALMILLYLFLIYVINNSVIFIPILSILLKTNCLTKCYSVLFVLKSKKQLILNSINSFIIEADIIDHSYYLKYLSIIYIYICKPTMSKSYL